MATEWRAVGIDAFVVQQLPEPAALKTSGLPLNPSAVSWRALGPETSPSLQFTAADPASWLIVPALVRVVTEPTPSIDPPPPVMVNVTATLETPLPFGPITRTVGLFWSGA